MARQSPRAVLSFWILATSIFCFLAVTRAAPPTALDIPDAVIQVPGKLVPIAESQGIRIISYEGVWSAFFSMGGGSEAILLITGKLENLKDTPLTYVKFQLELLGEQDIVVFRDYGYNRKAEPLRDEDYESGTVSLEDKGIVQVGPKEEESFRFIFFKKEIPAFRSFRIRLLETH